MVKAAHQRCWRGLCPRRKISIMKFSYRITALAILGATLVVVMMTWGNDIIMWDDTSHLSTKQKMGFTHSFKQQRDPAVDMPALSQPGLGNNPPQLNTQSALPFKEGMCGFGDLQATQSSVDTLNILGRLNASKVSITEPPRQIRTIEEQMKTFKDHHKGLPLKIIAVPHSHSDPGWHKTVNGYFEGQTKHTLNNMVDKLLKYPKMTFIWAESVFLSLWWQDIGPDMQSSVQELIRRGQLEVVVGSWVVPDEANPHYFALIDQMIEGHQWLENNMGVKPRNVWTLDPFGYSSTLPFLYKRAGYENMVILRVHEKVKSMLQNNEMLEFNWRQRWDQVGAADIFTQLMPYKLYNIKHTCGPDPNVCVQFDFRRIPGEISEGRAQFITNENVDRQARLLLDQYLKKVSLFKHNVVLVPIGDDFRYDRNIEWDQQYENYQKLFDYINSQKHWNIQAKFGTIQTYFDELGKTMKALNTTVNDDFPTLSGDFFPYTDQNNEFWTGYFTTRPFDKTLGRELEVSLRGAEILNSIAGALALSSSAKFLKYASNLNDLGSARQDLGLFQHHDGITGTERSWVALDYEERLKHGLDVASGVIKNSLAYILAKDKKHQGTIEEKLLVSHTKSRKMLTPINGKVDIPRDKGIDLLLYNSLGRAKQELVHLKIDADSVEVIDDGGNILTSQINPVWTPKNTISETVFELVFIVELPPLSVTTYHIKPMQSGQKGRNNYLSYIRLYNHHGYTLSKDSRFQVRPPVGDRILLENDMIKAFFSSKTGYLQSVTTKPVVKTTQVELSFRMYKSRMSGAYLFGPAGPAVDTELDRKPMVRVVRGPVVSEVHVIQELVNHTVRICNVTGPLGAALEINNVVDMRAMDEKELIMHIATDIHNEQGTFYTDQNGYQAMKRQRFENFPTEANYYPFTAYTYLEDHAGRLSIISAQPLGVGSLAQGDLEVMLDRRLSYDDMRGLGEGVQDNKRTPSRFYLLTERPSLRVQGRASPVVPPLLSYPSLLAHQLVEDLRHYAIHVLANLDSASTHSQYQALSSSLPCDSVLVNLRALPSQNANVTSAAMILHRLGYTCDYPLRGAKCSPSQDQVTTLSLDGLFKDVHIKDAVETTLSLMHNKRVLNSKDKYKVDLRPMEIYTYRLKFG